MASINLINVNPHYDYWTSNKIKAADFLWKYVVTTVDVWYTWQRLVRDTRHC